MGLLDLYSKTAGINEPALQTVPRTLEERVEVTAAETFAPDRYFNQGARRDAWQRAADELHMVTGEALPNPYSAMTPDEMMRLGNQPAVESERRTRIIDAYRAARETDPDRFQSDPESIDRQIGEESTRRRETAARYEGTGNGILNFLAAAVLETATPHGVAGLFVPVTRLPSAAANAVGRTFFANVGKEAIFQGVANAGLQAGAEGLDYLSRSETGSAQSLGEVLTNVAGAGVIGGAIGGGARALHLKWLGLPEKVRADAPLEVRDAFRAIEADAIYSGRNRLGYDPMLHERFMEASMDPILRGRPIDFADLARSADTPFTALGTILRQPVDTSDIRVRDPAPLFARIVALPDSEIAPFAREVKPTSFARLDKIDAEIGSLRAKLSEVERAPNVADLLDEPAASTIRKLQEELSSPNLSRADRDIRLGLALQNGELRDPMFAQLVVDATNSPRVQMEAQLLRLEKQRFDAQSTADKATADLRRKLERYADLVEKPKPDDIMRDLGFREPAGLEAAIARADMMRQARVIREVLPEGMTQPQTRAANVAPEGAATAKPDPEMQRALDTEAARVVEARPSVEVEINGRTMTAKEAMDDADRQAKDAQAALGCAMGSL